MTTVLVTGGAGYVGSHSCRALHDAGYTPVTYDDLGRGHADAVQWGPLEVGSLLDDTRIKEVFSKHRPEAVLHFAAYADVGESVSDPGLYYRNNVTGSLALLEAMHKAGTRQLVFSSTCATYGTPGEMPITERAPQLPINPYGTSKLMVERILRDYEHTHGIRSVVLRYFNAAGADRGSRIGERHRPETHLLPLVLAACAGERGAIEVFGDDYPTRDGTCVRDFVHVDDLADAHIAALGHLRNGGAGFACNLGTGHGVSVREVIDTVEDVTGRPVPMRVAARRPGDPPELVADASLARDVLGWTPTRSDLRRIVSDAWNWFRSSPERSERTRP